MLDISGGRWYNNAKLARVICAFIRHLHQNWPAICVRRYFCG